MSVSTYNELLTEVMRLIDGEDASITTIPVGTLQNIVLLAEAKIYRDVRCRFNEKPFSNTFVTGNLAAIPADLQAIAVIHFGKKSLLPLAEDALREYLQMQRTGDCRFFADAGTFFSFAPAVADGTPVQGRYFCSFPALSTSSYPTNTLFLANSDLFLYGALSEAAEFFPVGRRIEVWGAKYLSTVRSINYDKMMSSYSAGRMIRSASTVVMR